MNKNNESHPGITHQQELIELCAPLNKFGIDYFSHVKVENGHFSAISNHAEFHQHYIQREYYNVDIHLAEEGFVKDFFVWDTIDYTGLSQQMNTEASEFGIHHTFTIFEKINETSHYYHFSTSIDSAWLNQTYVSNLDLLKLFTQHFTHHVQRSPILSRFHDFKYGLNLNHGEFATTRNEIMLNQANIRKEFLHELDFSKQFKLPNGAILSARHLDVLYWLHNGKTIHDIARILEIADITVNKHIADIKNKLGCYTQFQLGEYFAKLLASYPEYMNEMNHLRNTG